MTGSVVGHPPGPAPVPAGGGRRPGHVHYKPDQLARLLGLPEPTAEQAQVIGAPLRPLAVIAGAGSGKSETMAARVVYLVANGMVRPERVLGLTFTRKAAAELGQRVAARLEGLRRAGVITAAGEPAPATGGATGAAVPLPGPGGGAEDGEPVVSTYHAYAARLVTDHALREAMEPTLRLATPALAWQIAARVVASYGGPMDGVDWAPPGVTAAVLALAGELAEHLCSPDDVRHVGTWLEEALARAQAKARSKARGKATGPVPALAGRIIACQRAREQLLPLVAAYAEAKAAREVIDHGDQVALAARIAARHPEVGAAERARFQVVLLDEYQDTSHAQLVLLRALFGGGHPVTAVGDPCQSIYGWRGASAGNLRRFTADFPVITPWRDGADESRGAGVTKLTRSFRNTGQVLDVADAIQEGLRREAPEVPVLEPGPQREGRGMVVHALLETVVEEARWVAERIGELLALPPGIAPDGEPWPDGGQARVRPGDIAVLCRKRTQFPALRAAIEARGIPVEVVGLGGLLTVPEVADVVATLRVLHDPAASAPLARLLTGPRWRIGPRDLVALGRRARDLAAAERSPGPGSGPDGEQPGAADPLAAAVADLTAGPGSLVEALDDLGDPAAYSPAARGRFAALGAELRLLRSHTGRPLPDLVGEVERVLGLDIEVASHPGRDPAAARADLDAFADAAAAFADDREEPTLGAFLAYLSAAQEEEFGLETGRPPAVGAVTLTTVHAAKGLEWPAVVVPGLSAGARSRVFPARPRTTTRWTENPRLLPFRLRGDAGDLPALAGLTPEDLRAFREACDARDNAEERRLAYVAVTRAAFWLACTGYWWGEGSSRLGPSEFLQDVSAARAKGPDGKRSGPRVARLWHWAPEPPEGAENPMTAEPAAAHWPPSGGGEGPGGVVREAAREAAAMVERALATTARADRPGARPAGVAPSGAGPAAAPESGVAGAAAVPESGVAPSGAGPAAVPESGVAGAAAGAESGLAGTPPTAPAADLTGADLELAHAWERDTGLLLSELADRRGESATQVALPGRLSVSALVTMAADPAALAQQIRRPMPRPPSPRARRGSEFHRWLEGRFGEQRLIDPSDLLGAADDPGGEEDAGGVANLRERFEGGEWGTRWPLEVEVPFETLIAGRLVRGRIDAVFGDGDGGYDVVDWKTGRPPATAGEGRAVAVQLAAYRLAWAGLAGVPVTRVRAAFYYVRHDLTVRPADLLDEAGLAALIERIPPPGPQAGVRNPPPV